MKAIILNNLIINHRCFLFWKELVMIAIILVVTIFQTQTQKTQAVDDPSFYNPKMVIVVYSILAMLLIARSSVMVHMDNRKKFVYFQKAYGLNTLAYIVTWILYSLVMGAIKFFIYILIIYFYLKGNDQFFSQFYHGYGFPG
jgi:hypothetical protein